MSSYESQDYSVFQALLDEEKQSPKKIITCGVALTVIKLTLVLGASLMIVSGFCQRVTIFPLTPDNFKRWA